MASATLTIVYGFAKQTTSAARNAPYSLAQLHARLQAPYALQRRVRATLNVRYTPGRTLARELRGAHRLLPATPVSGTCTAVYGLFAPAAEFVRPVTASVNGTLLRVTGLEIRCDEDSYCISCTLTVATAAEWSCCSPGDALLVQFGETGFTFLLNARSRDRKFGETRYTLSGFSPAMRLNKPYATPMTRTWSRSTARSIARELCAAHGVTLDWRLADWPLPLYSADAMTPLEVLYELVTQAGVLFSTPDGTLVAQYLHPVSPTRYAFCEPELVLSDLADVIALTDSYESSPGYNAVSVLLHPDQPETEVALMVWDGKEDGVTPADADTQRIVALFPSRLTGLQTPQCDVRILDQGVRSFEKEEIVAVVNGQATLSYPPDALLTHAYRCQDLGEPAISGRLLATPVAGHGVLHVRYRSSYRCFLVAGKSGTQALVYAAPKPDLLQESPPRLLHIRRAPADKEAPEIIEDDLCTNEVSARERGRNYLDENGFNKEWYEAQTPPRTLPQPGAIAEVRDTARGTYFRAKITGWAVSASLEGDALCSRVTYDLVRSLNASLS